MDTYKTPSLDIFWNLGSSWRCYFAASLLFLVRIASISGFGLVVAQDPPLLELGWGFDDPEWDLQDEDKRKIYDQYGSMGLKLAEQIGEFFLDLFLGWNLALR